MTPGYDLLVIGGGINGAGIARDAAGRGLKVALVEKDDLAAHTSSASTKLIHGGLRYLESYQFRLVRESLRERELLLRAAPHIVRPLRFVLPHEPAMRPRWLIRLGLALYDRIGGARSLPPARAVDLRRDPHRTVLQDRLTRGFAYSDCWVDDARLVALVARDAAERGAAIQTRTRCTALERRPGHWRATLRSSAGERVVEARAVINAAGPWVDGVARLALGRETPGRLRLVKGSHIVIPRAYPGEHAYIFQQPDGRIVFAIPYERDFTLIGTTDVPFTGDPDAVAIDAGERAYLCAAASRVFRSGVSEREIVSAFSGVRPLYDDGAAKAAAVTRDYTLALDTDGGAPLLSVYGGKLTTFRSLAEHALARLAPHLPMGGDWTAAAPLPGGDMPQADFAAFLWRASERWAFVPPEMLQRLARAYGTALEEMLGTAQRLEDLGEALGGTLYEAELRHLAAREFARTGEDVLRRRSKLGLHLPPAAQARVAAWMQAHAATA